MPVIMRKMTAIAGIVTPEDVAISHISDIENGHYLTTNGLMGWFLGVGTAGASPERSLLQAFAQIFLAGLVRGILLLIIGYFNSLSRNQMAGKKQQENICVLSSLGKFFISADRLLRWRIRPLSLLTQTIRCFPSFKILKLRAEKYSCHCGSGFGLSIFSVPTAPLTKVLKDY
ncbi:hypothetical protein Y032_0498g2520 [Ancylostoma ceylanicum]|uniref:Uncharacterized protein n=2 Tax=Ancylostoma ceylanicum TaxID=53326 RepID=A0A016WVG2_9BILA|nr:hypothetical protein Y032_0498g2520 [Ancylostoma ceylanicum]